MSGSPSLSLHVDRLALAAQDVADTLQRWRLWVALGGNDVGQRYRRSRLGQFWITLSMAVFVTAIGSIYATLFRTDIAAYLPHLFINYIVWTFIATTVNEACTAFVEAEGFLRQERLPKLAFIMRVLWRNLLVLAHNLVLVPIVFVVFGMGVSWVALQALAGFAFVIVNVALAAVIVATLCARFRDLRQVVLNLTQLLFFASPIMWKAELVPDSAAFIVALNPVAAHLALVSEPLLGQAATPANYAMCAGVTLVLAAIAIPLFTRFRGRIVYWL